jgi:hypothetical protein
MAELDRLDPFHGLFTHADPAGASLSRHPSPPQTLTDPQTGRPLKISTVDVGGGICPSCEQRGHGGFVSFVADLRVVFACPHCCDLVWINGA